MKMARFGWIAGMVLIAGAAIAFAMNEVAGDKVYSWRYKMTVAVETPEGVKIGSAVRKVKVRFTPNSSEGSGYSSLQTMEGEAVVVDLGERGKLFALLEDGSPLPFRVFHGPPGLTIEGAEYYSTLRDAKATLTPTHYPMMVTFTDLNDPKTVAKVLEMETDGKYPLKYTIKADHFANYFGEGVRLKEVAIEMTDKPVTWGIEKYISWLPSRKSVKGYLGGESTYPYEDPSKTYLTGTEFSKGKFWLIDEVDRK